MNYFLNVYNENEDILQNQAQTQAMEIPLANEELVEDNGNERSINDIQEKVNQLKEFLSNAPNQWDPENPIQRFQLFHGETISCILWNGLFFMTGTDIVRTLVYRFELYGRPVKNFKKFEEGIFSDLRNLKPGIDAILEEPRSEFLEMLYRSNCIRTQKKQKVFFWFSVPHDRLFIDALERDLKRESMGTEPTTEELNPNANKDEMNNELNENEEIELDDDIINTSNPNSNKKRHPLAHSGIPLRVDKHLIYDNASLNPGNNQLNPNHHQQQLLFHQQRQLFEQQHHLNAFPLNLNLNPFNHSPTNYLLPFDNSLLNPNFMSYSPQLFCNPMYPSPSLSDDMSSFDKLSPTLDRQRFHPMSFDNPFLNFGGCAPDPFLTNIKQNPFFRQGYPKELASISPYQTKAKNLDMNERPHVCQVEYCGRAFKRSDQLRRHHKTHEHPHACPHSKCPRTFNRKDQLAQHLALHHPEHLDAKGEIITDPAKVQQINNQSNANNNTNNNNNTQAPSNNGNLNQSNSSLNPTPLNPSLSISNSNINTTPSTIHQLSEVEDNLFTPELNQLPQLNQQHFTPSNAPTNLNSFFGFQPDGKMESPMLPNQWNWNLLDLGMEDANQLEAIQGLFR